VSPGEAPQTTRGYIPIGLPLGRMRAQPQLPSTFEEGQVKPAATITVGNKILKISRGSAPDSTGSTIASINPQQAVDHAVPISKEENQRLLLPIIEVVHTENNTLKVRARLQEITAPTISDQQIQILKNEIASLVDTIINNYRYQGSIPEDFTQVFEMAKALKNSPNAQFHSALLRINEEMLADGRIIRLPVLNITFYLPENEVKILQEAARIKTQSIALRRAGISTGETDTETDDATTGQTQNAGRNQPRMQSVGTYKRSQVLQPTFEETEPEGTNRIRTRRQTAADRLVAVSFELSAGNYGELLTDDLDSVEQIILDIYNQFKREIESGGIITNPQDSTEFDKDIAPGETLKDAIKEATQFLDFQIARRILTTMQNSRIPQLYAQRINAEYAAFLTQARQYPEEFERITQQSALPVEQEGPITFMARPIVKDDRLELLVLGYARTTPYLLKIQGADNEVGLISEITNAYTGISQQSFEGRKQYSGGIFARYNLTLQNLDGQIEARLVEPPIQKGFAPEATLASGAVGLPSGIVTIVGTAGIQTTQMNARVAAQPETVRPNETPTPETAVQDEGGAEPNSAAAGGDIGTLSALLNQIGSMLSENAANQNNEGTAGNTTAAGTEPEAVNTPTPITEEPAPAAEPQVRKQFDHPNINIIRVENVELELTEADGNEPKVRIFIIADGGTTDNQSGRDALKPTGTGTIVIGIIKDEQSGKKKVKVYRINHLLGDKGILTNNRAEAFALLTGATLAREMIETLMENGVIQDKNKVEIWMMSDSQVMVGQISGWAEIRDPFLKELVKRTVGTIKDQAGRIRIAHHSKSNGNPLGRLIHEVDHLSRIPRGDRGGGSYQPLDIATELEQALSDFKTKTEAQNYQDLGRNTVSDIRKIEAIEAIQRNEPLTIVRITDLIPQSESNTPGQVFDLDISDFVNDFRQSISLTNQESAPAPQTPEPAAEPAPASPATPAAPAPAAPAPTPAPEPQAAQRNLRLFNKVFGSIKNPEATPGQQKPWSDIYPEFQSQSRITPKHISSGSRGISKQLLMLIGGAQRAEHRPALDDDCK
jgi:ribonuclease HI